MKNRFLFAMIGLFIATIFWLSYVWANFTNGNMTGTLTALSLTLSSIVSMIAVFVRYKKTE